MSDIYIIVEHMNGNIEDITFEMLGKANSMGGHVTAIFMGNNNDGMIKSLGKANNVISCSDPNLENYNPESYLKTLSSILAGKTDAIIMIGNTSMGMDLAAGLSVDLDMPVITYANDLSTTSVTSALYGGKMSVESSVSGGYIVSIMPASFSADDGRGDGSPTVENVSAPDLSGGKITFKRLIEPESGDVDITQHDVLVSVGRGIQNEDNIEIVQELADKLGGALSCSRPIVDNKWLAKSRQVGKSGLKVKPKLYICIGISGAPEHIEGMKDADCIIAINTDSNAPIFDYAHYGTTEDLFDVVPAITEAL